jgi:hypothetical protein
MHPIGLVHFLVVHAKEGSEEGQSELIGRVSCVLDSTSCKELLTKNMVTRVNAIIARPCLTLSSALLSAALASMILACCSSTTGGLVAIMTLVPPFRMFVYYEPAGLCEVQHLPGPGFPIAGS